MPIITITPKKEDIELIELLAEDLKIQEVADELKLSSGATYERIAFLKGKYSCKNTYGLVALFFRNKLIK